MWRERDKRYLFMCLCLVVQLAASNGFSLPFSTLSSQILPRRTNSSLPLLHPETVATNTSHEEFTDTDIANDTCTNSQEANAEDDRIVSENYLKESSEVLDCLVSSSEIMPWWTPNKNFKDVNSEYENTVSKSCPGLENELELKLKQFGIELSPRKKNLLNSLYSFLSSAQNSPNINKMYPENVNTGLKNNMSVQKRLPSPTESKYPVDCDVNPFKKPNTLFSSINPIQNTPNYPETSPKPDIKAKVKSIDLKILPFSSSTEMHMQGVVKPLKKGKSSSSQPLLPQKLPDSIIKSQTIPNSQSHINTPKANFETPSICSSSPKVSSYPQQQYLDFKTPDISHQPFEGNAFIDSPPKSTSPCENIPLPNPKFLVSPKLYSSPTDNRQSSLAASDLPLIKVNANIVPKLPPTSIGNPPSRLSPTSNPKTSQETLNPNLSVNINLPSLELCTPQYSSSDQLLSLNDLASLLQKPFRQIGTSVNDLPKVFSIPNVHSALTSVANAPTIVQNPAPTRLSSTESNILCSNRPFSPAHTTSCQNDITLKSGEPGNSLFISPQSVTTLTSTFSPKEATSSNSQVLIPFPDSNPLVFQPCSSKTIIEDNLQKPYQNIKNIPTNTAPSVKMTPEISNCNSKPEIKNPCQSSSSLPEPFYFTKNERFSNNEYLKANAKPLLSSIPVTNNFIPLSLNLPNQSRKSNSFLPTMLPPCSATNLKNESYPNYLFHPEGLNAPNYPIQLDTTVVVKTCYPSNILSYGAVANAFYPSDLKYESFPSRSPDNIESSALSVESNNLSAVPGSTQSSVFNSLNNNMNPNSLIFALLNLAASRAKNKVPSVENIPPVSLPCTKPREKSRRRSKSRKSRRRKSRFGFRKSKGRKRKNRKSNGMVASPSEVNLTYAEFPVESNSSETQFLSALQTYIDAISSTEPRESGLSTALNQNSTKDFDIKTPEQMAEYIILKELLNSDADSNWDLLEEIINILCYDDDDDVTEYVDDIVADDEN